MQEEKDVKGLNSRSAEEVGSRGIFRRKNPSQRLRLRKPGCEEPGSGCARRAVARTGLGSARAPITTKGGRRPGKGWARGGVSSSRPLKSTGKSVQALLQLAAP